MPAGRAVARPERTPEQKASAAAARQKRLEDLHAQMASGVAALRDGEAWQKWLTVAARFHHYSFGNQLLIAAQRPEATRVAGYGAWNALGRQVRKGEKAIWILAPVAGARRPADLIDEPDELTSKSSPGPELGPAEGRRGGRVRGFTSVAVFDVSQTDGDPLPAPPRPALLAGAAPPGLWESLTEAVAARGFTVGRCHSAADVGGANGVTDFASRTVTVRSDVHDAQAVKTLAHEAGNVLLHDALAPGIPGPECRDLIEVEAESVAYLVSAHHGLQTDDYSFAYIASWAGRDHDAVARTTGRVLSAARTLIVATDRAGEDDRDLVDAAATGARAGVSATRATASRAGEAHDRLADRLLPSAERLRAVLSDAQGWFLAQAEASKVYAETVLARGHAVPNALGYGVGFAPASWTGLVDHLRDRGHTLDDLLAAGVAVPARSGRPIDRFRGRITFPVHGELGVVGFTARDTTGQPGSPKYLNTPATALYDKGSLLFGIQHLEQRTTTVVLAEGPWDAVAVTAAGEGGIVGLASCGTAVTGQHLDLAGRDERRLVLAPDADGAGTAALGRTLALLHQRGAAHPGAVRSTAGKDIADLHGIGGPGAVRAALACIEPAGLVYAQAHLAHRPPADTPEARVRAARASAAYSFGLAQSQLSELADVLVDLARITPEAARALVVPPAKGRRPVAPRTPLRAPRSLPRSDRSVQLDCGAGSRLA